MLGKTSVSMMVLLVAASLIGISSIHQYIEAQAPPARTLEGAGKVGLVRMFDSSAGKACTTTLQLKGPNSLKLQLGTDIDLWVPNEHFCTLLVLSKMFKTDVGIVAQNVRATSLPPAILAALRMPANNPDLYRVSELNM
jgi:hypothetical protein